MSVSWGNFLLNSRANGNASLPLPHTAAARAAAAWVCLLLSNERACCTTASFDSHRPGQPQCGGGFQKKTSLRIGSLGAPCLFHRPPNGRLRHAVLAGILLGGRERLGRDKLVLPSGDL